MMKNKKMGILAVLVMLVAVTFNAVGGTYAKYISNYSMTDQARVAVWNFKDTAVNEVDLFEASYSNQGGVYVASKDASKVIAPGTNGEYKFNIRGTAETNYKITKTTKIVNKVVLATAKGSYNEGTLLYDPVKFDLGDGEFKSLSERGIDVSYDEDGNPQLVYEVNDTTGIVYAANYELSATDVTGTIKWDWAFSTSKDNDTMDTKLGKDVVANSELKITAAVGVTVEQTQEQPTPATKKPVSLSNKLNRVASLADANAADIAAYGMNVADYEKVVFNGVKLSGTIYQNNSKLAKDMFGTMATGYYYPLVVSEDAARVEWTGQLADGTETTLGWNNIKAGEVMEIGLYNNSEKSLNKFKIEVKDAKDGDVIQSITVDYSELAFN